MLYIKRTHTTPEISLDLENGTMTIAGLSSPDQSIYFYQPVIKAFETFPVQPDQMTANFRMTMFNTSSAKCLYEILKKLKTYAKSGTNTTINWYYDEDDEDMLECGEDFSDLLGLNFNFIENEELAVPVRKYSSRY